MMRGKKERMLRRRSMGRLLMIQILRMKEERKERRKERWKERQIKD